MNRKAAAQATNQALCPTCRQPLPDTGQLLVDLDHDTAVRKGIVAYLTRQEAEFLAVLADEFPHVALYSEIYDGVWGKAGKPDTARAMIGQYSTRLNKKLAYLGVKIEVATMRGYRMLYTAGKGGGV